MDYADGSRVLTEEHAQGMRIALQYRDRILCIRFSAHETHLRHFIAAFIEKELPILEYLLIKLPETHSSPLGLRLPNTFQTPHLRHLALTRLTFPTVSPLLTTTVGIVTLSLKFVIHCHPNNLLERLALLPRLETLKISLPAYLPLLEMHELRTPPFTHVTLPNLRWFWFKGISDYLEILLLGMATPLLEKLQITFFCQLNFSVPCLQQYMSKIGNLNFCSAKLAFNDKEVAVSIYPHEGARTSVFSVHVLWPLLGWKPSSLDEIFDILSPLFFAVVDLTLDYSEHILPPEPNDDTCRALWRKFLMSFNNVKTLRIHEDLVGDLSRSLRPDREPPLEILPELQVLICPAGSDDGDAFTAFIHARKVAGHLVRLVHVVAPDSPPASTGKSRLVRENHLARLWF